MHRMAPPMYQNILECIGATPLIHLQRYQPQRDYQLYAKCEMFNPSMSIKDRIALHMIRQMEQSGVLKPGMMIVEASSGNTGTSLAMVGSVLGYSIVITVPQKTSQEKIKMMQIYGAEVIVCPASADVDSPEHYINHARIHAQKTGGVLFNQYESLSNVETHMQNTAQEIWQQMAGNIDYVVATASSGGTITGLAKYLKAQKPAIKVIMPDPVGSIFKHYFVHKNTNHQVQPYQVEGAGKDKVCPIHDFSLIDDVIPFTDDQAITAIKQLARTEGIWIGGSAGGTLVAVNQLAQSGLQGKNIVVIFPDSGIKYLSKGWF